MEVMLILDRSPVEIEPGGSATVPLRIINKSSIVEGYELSVVGPVAEWAKVHPASITTYKSGEGSDTSNEANATIVFAPPAGVGGPVGTFVYGIRARSVSRPGESVVEEGRVTVAGRVELTTRLSPPERRVFRKGTFTLELRNEGNAPVRARVRAFDESDTVVLRVDPVVVDLPAGAVATTAITASAPLNLASTEKTHALVVECAELRPDAPSWAPAPITDQGAPDQTEFRLVQRRVLTRPVRSIAVLAVLGAAFPFVKDAVLRPPPVPAGLSVTASDPHVDVRWEAVAKATGYVLRTYAGRGDDAPQLTKVAVEKETLSMRLEDALVEKGRTVCVRVQAKGRFASSALSGQQCQSAAADPSLPKPQGVRVSRIGEKPSLTRQVKWAVDPAAASFEHHVVSSASSDVVTAKPGENTAIVKLSDAADRECFTVQAVDPKRNLTGLPSDDPACVSSTVFVGVVGASMDPTKLQDLFVEAKRAFGEGAVRLEQKQNRVVLKQTFDDEDQVTAACEAVGWPRADCDSFESNGS